MAYVKQLNDRLERLELAGGGHQTGGGWRQYPPAPSPPRSYPDTQDGAPPPLQQQQGVLHLRGTYFSQGDPYPPDSLPVRGSQAGVGGPQSLGDIPSSCAFTSLALSPPRPSGQDIRRGAGGASPPVTGAPSPGNSQTQDTQIYHGRSGGGGVPAGGGGGGGGGPPTSSALLHGFLSLGSQWAPVTVGGNHPQLDFTGVLGQHGGGDYDYGAAVPSRSGAVLPGGWGAGPCGVPGPGSGLPLAGSSPPHPAPSGNAQFLQSSGGLAGDWRIPGSSRRPEQEPTYPRQLQNGQLAHAYEQLSAGQDGGQAVPQVAPAASGSQATRHLPPGPIPEQLSHAHGIGMDPHALFHEPVYRGRTDPGQPGTEVWKSSNGNVSSGLDALSGDPTFWPGSSAARHPQRSQAPFPNQTQGLSQPGTFVPQYNQASQAAPAQNSRSQRGKREQRRSSGGGGRGNARSFGPQPARGSNRRSAPVAPPRPPSWADADWHPMKAVASAKVGQATGGTGVFLPGAPKAAPVDNPRNGQPPNVHERLQGNEFMQPQSRGRVLPDEWVY